MRAEIADGAVAIYWRGECLGMWLVADRRYEFQPEAGWTNGVIAHTILGVLAFTEGSLKAERDCDQFEAPSDAKNERATHGTGSAA